MEAMAHPNAINNNDDTFKNIFETAINGILIIQSDIISYINPAAAQFFDYTTAELVGKPISMLAIKNTKKKLDACRYNDSLARSMFDRFECGFKNREGEEVSLECGVMAIQFAEKPAWLIFMSDISDLKNNNNFFDSIVRAMSARSGQELFDWTVTVLTDWLDVDVAILGEFVEGDKLNSCAMVSNGKRIDGYVCDLAGTPYELIRKLGSCFYPESVADLFPADRLIKDMPASGFLGGPLIGRGGKPIGALSVISKNRMILPLYAKEIFTIIAARASVEIERLQLERDLQEKQRQYLRTDRLRALGEMATSMAHEFNQPLSAIRSFAESILISKKRGWPVKDADLMGELSEIIRLTERMSGLIDHIRDFSSEADTPEVSIVNLKDVIEASLLMMAAQLRARGIDIVFEHVAAPVFIKANTSSLEEVLLSILTNARDAVTKSSEKKITISFKKIDLTGGKAALIEIRDTGEGMQPEDRARAFDPFFSTKGPEAGTGLGLTTARNLVRLFGGQIELHSDFGKGTVVRILFPIEDDITGGMNEA